MNNPTPIEVQKYLSDIDYPASKDEIYEAAEDQGAPDDVLDALRSLPDGDYESPVDISAELGGDD